MPRPGPPAIFFHADAIEGDGKDLVGRRSAGQSFLRGYLQHSPGDQINVVTQHLKAGQAFDTVARGLGETRPIAVKPLRGPYDFTEFGTVFFPAPGYMNAAWRRQRFGPDRCSLVGITHTISTRRVIQNLHNLMLEPVEPWDAIICTSRAVQSVMQRQFAVSADYIRQRFGATRVPQPQLPIIPLGIHTDDFSQTADDRAAMRARFDAPDDAIVVMTMGRLTSVEKANPAPLLMALEELAQATGKAIHLWMVGWSSRDDETKLHVAAAKTLAPHVTSRIIDGRQADVRRHIWAGADIFTLPVDNIQETFGLVPVEAMAAGLPVVMPDWNGFRDTVLHDETGFLIPTAMPAPGSASGDQVAGRFADGTDDYLRYLSLIQQQTQLDMRAYVQALRVLIDNPDKRRHMGQAGQNHVRKTFDWAVIIPQYHDLARQLAKDRKGASATTPSLAQGVVSPVEIDPFDLYQHYPTAHVTDATTVSHRKLADVATLDRLDAVNGRALYQRRIIPNAKMAEISEVLSQTITINIGELIGLMPQNKDVMIGAILFLAKYDFVTLTPQQKE